MSTPSVDVQTIYFAAKGMYNTSYGKSLHVNTTNIDSNIETIVCSNNNKA